MTHTWTEFLSDSMSRILLRTRKWLHVEIDGRYFNWGRVVLHYIRSMCVVIIYSMLTWGRVWWGCVVCNSLFLVFLHSSVYTVHIKVFSGDIVYSVTSWWIWYAISLIPWLRKWWTWRFYRTSWLTNVLSPEHIPTNWSGIGAHTY